MAHLRSWFTGIRLLAMVGIIALSTGSASAWQPDFKPTQEDEPGDDATSEEQPGLISDTEYESPQFGVGITWGDSWKVGDPDHPDVEYAIGGNFDGPVASDPDLGDIIFLQDTASETSVLSLGFSPASGVDDPELTADMMEETEFLTENLFLSEDAEVLLLDSNETTAAVLAREAAPNDDHVVYMAIVGDPGNDDYTFWAGLDLYDPDEYETIITSIEDDIEIEDNTVFDVFDAEEVIAALEAEPTPDASPTAEMAPTEEATEAATPEATEEQTAEASPDATVETIDPPSAASPTAEASPVSGEDGLPGVTGEGTYVSPQHDVDVTWDTDWILDEDATPAPAVSVEGTGLDILYLTDAEEQETDIFISVENQEPVYEADAAEAALTSPQYIEGILGLSADTEVILSEATDEGVGVLYRDGDTVIILEMRVIDEDTVAYVDVRTDSANVDDALLDSIEDSIQVNDDDALDIFSSRDILDALS